MNLSENYNQDKKSLLPRLLLGGLILAYFVYFGLYANRRYLAFESGAFDLGVYAQPLWNFTQGRDFAVSLIEDNGPIRWATHVEPILFPVALLYRLWPDPRSLIWLQVAGLSLAAVPLYGLARRRLHQPWAALVVVVAFFLLPATEAVTLFDFHAVALAPLFLLAAIYFLERALAARGVSLWLWPEERTGVSPLPGPRAAARFYGLAGLFFLLALSTKEDVSLLVLMIGLYLLLLRRRWWEGLTLVVVGLAWFYVAFEVVIPAFRTAGGHSIYAAWFETLGSTPLEIALSPFTRPDKVLAFLIRPDSLPALAMLTVPLVFLPLVGLPFFALAAPSLAFSLLSQNPTLRQLETWHYAAPMLAFVMLGTIDGLARLSYYASRLGGNRAGRPGFWLALLCLLLLLVASVYNYLRGYSPLSRLQEWPEVTAHDTLGWDLAGRIPAGASVLAQAQLVPAVAHREQLGIWSGPLLTDYDTIWLDLSHPRLPNRFNAHGELLTGLAIEPAFGVAAATDGYLLLQKGAERVPLADELFSFTQFDALPPQAWPVRALFGETLELIAVKPEIHRLATSETEPQLILYFEVRQPPAGETFLFVYLLDRSGAIVGATDYQQPAVFWWPIARWQAGDRRQVRVNTVPWWTGDQTEFTYALGLSSRNDPWDIAARLPVQVETEGSQPLDHDTLLPLVTFRRLAGLPYPYLPAILNGAGGETPVVGSR